MEHDQEGKASSDPVKKSKFSNDRRLTEDEIKRIQFGYDNDEDPQDIAKELNCHRATIKYHTKLYRNSTRVEKGIREQREKKKSLPQRHYKGNFEL